MTVDELAALRAAEASAWEAHACRIAVCTAAGCLSSGSGAVKAALIDRQFGVLAADDAGVPAADPAMREFLSKQQRIVLANAGRLDSEKLTDYIAAGGYEALKKALTEMTPDAGGAAVRGAQPRWLTGQIPQTRAVIVGISSKSRPSQNFSKPRNSAT